jgi:hypothetical protein
MLASNIGCAQTVARNIGVTVTQMNTRRLGLFNTYIKETSRRSGNAVSGLTYMQFVAEYLLEKYDSRINKMKR